MNPSTRSAFNWQKTGILLFLIAIITVLLPVKYISSIDFSNLLLIEKILFFIATVLYVAVTGLFLVEFYSICNVVFRRKKKNVQPRYDPLFNPLVSIHIPICSEPPDLVINTLRVLLKLKYKNYEVIVVDNNTKDPALWKPVEEYCKNTDTRLKFFHFDHLDGFKAGALNFALTKTDRKAEIIAVIDSDYFVKSDFLDKTVPYFKDPQVGIVQMPQHYRHAKGILKEGMYYAYKYFFSIAMNSANVFRAATFTGTMGLIRRSIIKETKGWDTRCITEDIELGVRILREGYKIIYIDEPGGKGYMPWEFRTYRTQRYRWVFGNGQVFRNFISDTLRGKFVHLPLVIKIAYFYLISIWFNMIGILFIALLFLFIINVFRGDLVLPLSLLLMTLVIEVLRKPIGLILYIRKYEGKPWSVTFNAIMSLNSLWFPSSFAWLKGLAEPNGVFWRTSKFKRKSDFLNDISNAQEEITMLAIAIVVCILSFSVNLQYAIGFFLCAVVFSTTIWTLIKFRKIKVN